MKKAEVLNILNMVEAIQDPALYIQKEIIPGMMIRRNKTELMSGPEIVDKVFSVNLKKPGEAYELIWGELAKLGHNLTSAVASEIADITYYTSQPNCPDYMNDPSPLFNGLGVSMELARRFCILKYTTRIAIGDEKYHKKIENNVLKHFLKRQNKLESN